MRRYEPVRGRRINTKRLAIVIVIVAVAAAVAIFCGYMFSKVELDAEAEQSLLTTGVYEEGVTIGGVDVAGLTVEQARVAVSPVVNQMTKGNKIEFTVQGEEAPYTYGLDEMGVSVDEEPVLQEAMLYGREGTRWDLQFGEKESKDFPLERSFDESVVPATINALAETSEWGEAAVNGSFKVIPTSNEEELATGGTIEKTEPKDGFKVKTEEITSTIVNQINTQQYAPFEAVVEVIKSTGASSGGELSLMGKKTTDFKTSEDSRRYNIWKMSSVLNGAVFYPGEEFSVNDTAGDRNEKNGWKKANGIENGIFTPQYGGGICQVSSTMYNATLMAEMKMINRMPHSIAAGYVPRGLDATISTGGPDFKVENILEDPMYMIIKCDGKEGVITVEVWGHDTRDYTVELSSEEDVAQRIELPAAEYKTNAALSTYAIEKVKKGQPKEVWQVYMQKVDKETGEKIGDKTKVTQSTYGAIAPLYELGPGVPVPAAGTPIESVTANRDAAAAAAGAAAAPPVQVVPDPVTPVVTPPPATAPPTPTDAVVPPAA